MITITAVIRVKTGCADKMLAALLEVAENVAVNEPGTVGFFISQDAANPHVFTTYERFLDRAAMDTHKQLGCGCAFFGIAKPILEGEAMLVTAVEISKKA